MDALNGNVLSEHAKNEQSSMEARDSTRLSAGELAAGHASDCKDGERATVDASDDHGSTGEDSRPEGQASVVVDSRKRISRYALWQLVE